MKRPEAGVTLIEILVAITLLSLLSLGMVLAIRGGLLAYSKTTDKLMLNRRVIGAQRILQQELDGMMPVFVSCANGPQGGPGLKAVAFQGTPQAMWLVSTFSLQRGWRGQPQLLQLFASGDKLLVNETPYAGPMSGGCVGTMSVPGSVTRLALFGGTGAGGKSFVLADQLAFARFSYLTPATAFGDPPTWQPDWHAKGWPLAIRIQMAPAQADPSRIQPVSVTAPVHIRRDPDKAYLDDK